MNATIDDLTQLDDRQLHKTCRVEVLVFHTAGEYETTNSEADFKKKIRAKFRSYTDALEYAHRLSTNQGLHKIIVRA